MWPMRSGLPSRGHDFKMARLRLYQAWNLRAQFMPADSLMLKRSLELSQLLRGDPDWQREREHVFEWLYPQLSTTEAPLLPILQAMREWAAILHVRRQRAEEAAVLE